MPFSDPLADGPVIQRASERALARGVTLEPGARGGAADPERSELPLLLFSYFNPLLQHGLERLACEAKESGVDGVLVTDLPPEEAGEWIAHGAERRSRHRLPRVADEPGGAAARGSPRRAAASCTPISRTGVTGERQSLSADARPLVERLRALTGVPVALGFGLSTPEQVREAAAVADGVVVGSALVRFLEEHPEGDLGAQVRWLTSTT